MPDLTRPKPEAARPGQYGVVDTPPAAVGDPFTVTVPSFSGDHFYEITRWQSRGTTLPAAGDEVLVVFDDRDEEGEPWVAAWWPAAGDDPVAGEPGPAGKDGKDGAAGKDGAPGAAGKDGEDGAPGADGEDGAPGAPGAAGKDGKDGADGDEGPPGSVWYEGEGAPAGGLGVDGDFYLRTSNGIVYRKEAGVWTIVGDITGPKGDPGPGAPFATWSELVEEYATWGSLV